MTYDFRITAADSATMYRDLALALGGLVSGEPDPIANMANAPTPQLITNKMRKSVMCFGSSDLA